MGPSTALDSSNSKIPLQVDTVFSTHATAYLFWKNQKKLRRHSWTSLELRLQCGVGAPDQGHLCTIWEPEVGEGLTLTAAAGFFHGTRYTQSSLFLVTCFVCVERKDTRHLLFAGSGIRRTRFKFQLCHF